jgi:hypothetical protein
VPKATASATNVSGGSDPARKKDELWNVFRGLEADFQKYADQTIYVLYYVMLMFLSDSRPSLAH